MIGYVIGFIGLSLFAIWVYGDAKERGMNAGFWAIFTFALLIIGLPWYLIARRSPSPTYQQGVTPSQKRHRKSVIQREETKRKWAEKLFQKRGIEDSQVLNLKTSDELEELSNLINNGDTKIFEILPEEVLSHISDDNYRKGFIIGLNRILKEKYEDLPDKPKRKYSTI